ncbi:hypothetical protein [Massilia sp. 9096]|uniref:hypothetical protein n=1 Tax=Massilia sp. 9096 TaxID=1500894 RepID=UPI00056C5A16|nr:hypothetical protein [Massilia sp. 9096]
MSLPSIRYAGAALLALGLLVGCKGEKPTTPPPKPVAAPASAPKITRDQAMAELMALPELKAWSAQIEKGSRGQAHGAVIEDDPAPRILDGKAYYQLSFVENRKQDVHRRASFLVAQQGDDILVEDDATDSVQSLGEWRRSIRKVELKSG